MDDNMTPNDDASGLWECVAAALRGRLDGMWQIMPTGQPGLAVFMRMGPEQGNVACYFSPRTDAGPGQGTVRLYLDPSGMRMAREFQSSEEAAKLPAGMRDLALIASEDPAFDPGIYHTQAGWDGMGMLCAISNVVSPMGPDLYRRMGPWYVDSLENLLRFMHLAYKHHVEGETRRATELRERAAAGDVDAQIELGKLCLSQDSAVGDAVEGAGWLLKAAKSGSAVAQELLAHCFMQGLGVEQDEASAKEWWFKAASQGNARAAFHYARLLESADEDGHEEYLSWYRKAADGGSIHAQDRLGRLLLQDDVPYRDIEEAERYLRMAAEGGSLETMEFLAFRYLQGDQIPANPKAAFEMLLMACKAGSRLCQENLGRLYEQGLGTDQDYGEAIKWYQQGIEKRSKNCALRLGNMHFHGRGVPRDVRMALRCWEHSRSLMGLGDFDTDYFRVEIRNGHLIAQKTNSLFGDGQGSKMVVDTGSPRSVEFAFIDGRIPGFARHMKDILGEDVTDLLGNDKILCGTGFVLDMRQGNQGALWIVEPGSKQAAVSLLTADVTIGGENTRAVIDTGAQYSFLRRELDPADAKETARDFSVYTGQLEHFEIHLQPLEVTLGDARRDVRFGNLPSHLSSRAFDPVKAGAFIGHELFKESVFVWNGELGKCWVEEGE